MQFKLFDLGLVNFEEAAAFQKKVFQEVKEGVFKSGLVLCRHYPVITQGRRPDQKNIRASQKELEKLKIKICTVERGGGVTYHGPGQLMVYPVFNLNYLKKDIHYFLRLLEEIALKTLNSFGISAKRKSGLTGAWFKDQKIASIGIAVKNWISYHGLAINVKADDLANFSLIRPCGMDIMMTSMESVLATPVGFDAVTQALIKEMSR